MVIFRMHSKSHGAFDTRGATLQEGRWHSIGTRVVYAAEHASLAVLETLIHAGGKKIPPRVMTRITVPDELPIERAAWTEMPHSQAFGDAWFREGRTALLSVPSIAVNKLEFNYVLNPHHPDFTRVTQEEPQDFVLDPRFVLNGWGI
jgi:RES domain-containing protein